MLLVYLSEDATLNPTKILKNTTLENLYYI